MTFKHLFRNVILFMACVSKSDTLYKCVSSKKSIATITNKRILKKLSEGPKKKRVIYPT